MKQEATETKLTFESYVMPMLCPPVPWTSVKFGAYLLASTKLMRTLDGATQHDTLLEKSQNLNAVLDSLNQLGNCAWKINKPMLDIIISIFNDRGSEKLDIPPPMSEAPKIPHFNPQDSSFTASEKAHMKREIITAKRKCGEMHSLRMDALYKLSIANHIRDKIFWFPHNMDFRGRTYPCPPYFNHLGSDYTRSILLFAEGKPLGPKGLDWLKIHLVNLTGLKKRSSLEGRLEYANTIMEDILDSADNPLNVSLFLLLCPVHVHTYIGPHSISLYTITFCRNTKTVRLYCSITPYCGNGQFKQLLNLRKYEYMSKQKVKCFYSSVYVCRIMCHVLVFVFLRVRRGG